MLILNTTFLVSDKIHPIWTKWVREQHIPFMLESGLLSQPQLAKVLSTEEQEGTSYSVQFSVENYQNLEEWHLRYAKIFEQTMAMKFGAEALFFASVLEIIE